VTANYPARAHGVGKLQLITAALEACPSLRLVNGEDLTPYRAVSARFLAVLSRFGPTEKLGLDEAFVDVTRAAAAAVAAARGSPAGALAWVGHVHAARDAVAAHNRHRPTDLSACGGGGADDAAADAAAEAPPPPPALPPAPGACHADALLAAGSAIAAEARAALHAELGLRASAGVAHNKLLAKLVSGLHKPDAQTCLPCREAARFVAPLPVRCLRGVGSAAERALAAPPLRIATVAALRRAPARALAAALGSERLGALLAAAARGRDASPVVPKAPPKALSVEDSFRSVASHAAAARVLAALAPDLVARCAAERADTGRRPRTLTLKWRFAPNGGAAAAAKTSASGACASARGTLQRVRAA
jgi:DNA polymerase iota